VNRSLLRRLAPVALLATGACFATQNDVRILQNDLQILQSELTATRAAAEAARVEAARRDSADRAVIMQAIALINSTRDSLVAANRRMSTFQGDVRGSLYNLGQQILAVQTLTGQSAERMREFRLQLERQNQQGGGPPPADSVAAASTGRGATPPTSTEPGPEQLYDIGLQQLRRQSYATARTAFSDLLQRYPTAVNAPDAQHQIGVAYEYEKNQRAADSVFALVVAKYPRSEVASTALYKHALSLRAQNRTAEWRPLIAKLRRDYPTSAEVELAKSQFPPPES
jgi:TolA-binding protein